MTVFKAFLTTVLFAANGRSPADMQNLRALVQNDNTRSKYGPELMSILVGGDRGDRGFNWLNCVAHGQPEQPKERSARGGSAPPSLFVLPVAQDKIDNPSQQPANGASKPRFLFAPGDAPAGGTRGASMPPAAPSWRC